MKGEAPSWKSRPTPFGSALAVGGFVTEDVELAVGPAHEEKGDGIGDRVVDETNAGAVEGPFHATVLVVAEALGQVLQQRSSAGHIDQLHAAADP